MTSRSPRLIIGGIVIPFIGSVESLTQDYEPLGGEALFRAADGSGLMQRTWKKTRIVTRGQGLIPAALDDLNYNQTVPLYCIQPLASRYTPLPPHRTDAPPWMVSVMPDGEIIEGITPGAAEILTMYFPVWQVWLLRPTATFDRNAASWSWQLVAEEA
ncbi:MAG: hypothetical protein LBI31_07325 [Zoogloeaceae bacterium]|jgi:hypothetical protein|nr:hypothetical protein [Zoogloeaceae bacterium]